ncbi:MAG: alpha/beta fold hydrolase [Oscillochloris sp.]|nr:alpha/beta fold hydrolase [Oscillochloris sp.]
MAQHDPFLIPGSPIGCLMFHGIGGSPAELRGLGEHLASRGHTVLGARLAGHGGSPADYYHSRWTEWVTSTEAAYDELRTHCSQIVVVGFSLGGVLGLRLTQHRPVAGLVTMGSRVLGGDWRFTLSPLLRYTYGWRDPSMAPLAELRSLISQVRPLLPKVQTPALVMHGRADTVIRPENAMAIHRQIASPQKELVWWEETGHQMLVEGPHRIKVYERIAAFVQGVAGEKEERLTSHFPLR